MRQFLFVCVLFVSVATFSKGTKVTGKLTNASGLKQIYLYELLGTEVALVDSAKIKKDAFQFKGSYGRGYYKLGFNAKNSAVVILADEEISFEADAKKVKATAKINGSKENKLMSSMDAFNKNYSTNVQSLQQEINRARIVQMRDPDKAQLMFNSVQHQYDSLLSTRSVFYENLINSNANSYMAKVAKFYLRSDTLKKPDFFSDKYINDPELQRGEMYVVLVSTYYQKFVGNKPNRFLSEAKQNIAGVKDGSKAKELLYVSFIQNLMAAKPESAGLLGKDYKKDFPASRVQKNLVRTLPAPPLGIGDEAPEIAEKTPDDEILALSSMRGKVVLLDFWASWCGPCRRENPHVVQAYQKYKDKGFTVYSVSLDKSKAKWLAAIKKDGLIWPNHVSDLRGWSAKPAKKYGVRGIPATFLLDKDGVIIGKNLRGASLDQKLEEILSH